MKYLRIYMILKKKINKKIKILFIIKLIKQKKNRIFNFQINCIRMKGLIIKIMLFSLMIYNKFKMKVRFKVKQIIQIRILRIMKSLTIKMIQILMIKMIVIQMTMILIISMMTKIYQQIIQWIPMLKIQMKNKILIEIKQLQIQRILKQMKNMIKYKKIVKLILIIIINYLKFN